MLDVHPGDRHYRSQMIRLSDLTVTEDIIRGVTFENCTLVGPAVVVLLGTTSLQRATIDGDTEGALWPIGARERVLGAIGLADCVVVGCRFQRIGFAVPETQEAIFRQGLGL